MKKHRPKVFDETKTRKTPKSQTVHPLTPKQKTPKRSIPRTSPLQKRKCMRKENPREAFDGTLGSATNSCRQRLDFNLENHITEQHGRDNYGGMTDAKVMETSFTKSSKLRPKVDLDAETLRAWKLLMENDGGEDMEEEDNERNKKRDNDREIFRGRVDSFISCMHCIQGDRRFSPWKGSVVDSVVGVFLTQNVSDHTSSSAFMSLAAKFPPSVTKQINTSTSNVSHQESVDSNKVDCGDTKSDNTSDLDVTAASCLTKSQDLTADLGNDNIDSVNWEAVRQTSVDEVAKVFLERGMNNILAGRIKAFLDRMNEDHESIDLEWLRDVPPDKAKDYLLSISGLGLKSTECVRLLTLRQHAFPVDTNVGRILVRLGWVPLLPLPEDLQIHLLNQYPLLDTVQKYIWPYLCKLSQETLYECHYQMITFGKVFCTKRQPNCNACPMRGQCKHFASAYASAKLRLPGVQRGSDEHESQVKSSQNVMDTNQPLLVYSDDNISSVGHRSLNSEPNVEIPSSPEPASREMPEHDIEDFGYESEDEILTIKLNQDEFVKNLMYFMENTNFLNGEGSMSNELVALSPEAASIPMPKLKFLGRLRTVHQVYEVPDSHPLLAGFEKRESDDPCPYLLAIWTNDETANSSQLAKGACGCQTTCDVGTCCSGDQKQNDELIRGTMLIPCRTANRGSFPLNGTYFQVNEVFADHGSSRRPISVARKWIWHLRRRSLYCGTSTKSIFRGMTTDEIQYCFWRGFICVRATDRVTREPKPLARRFHTTRNRQRTKLLKHLLT